MKIKIGLYIFNDEQKVHIINDQIKKRSRNSKLIFTKIRNKNK